MIDTERLTLRPFAPGDIGELHELFSDRDVRRYLLDDVCVSLEWVEEEVASSQARFAARGCGLWKLTERGQEKIVGFVGFRPFFDPPELQLLYGLLPPYWGRGYATEAAAAALAHVFDVMGIEEIRAASDAPNTASIAVLRRLGMEELHATRGATERSTPMVFFGIRADEWVRPPRASSSTTGV